MKYECIIFIQGDGAEEVMDIIEEHGEEAGMNYLSEYDYGEGEIEELPEPPWGRADEQYWDNDYVMTYNYGLSYVSLTRVIKD